LKKPSAIIKMSWHSENLAPRIHQHIQTINAMLFNELYS